MTDHYTTQERIAIRVCDGMPEHKAIELTNREQSENELIRRVEAMKNKPKPLSVPKVCIVSRKDMAAGE